MKSSSRSAIVATSLLATLFAGNALAAQTSGKIYSVQVEANGNFSLVLENTPNLCSNGNMSNNKRGAVVVGVRGVTADGLKAMYSAALAAFMAGKVVTVFTDEAVTTTGWGCTVYVLDVSP
ncbi:MULTISPECIES: hypothetical protein [unclassified Myxococcus]|uniref:hypothetical protein n=1 Tax=unclassified Myxococcus TaxID=2648731 RepID=UPI001CBCB84E|nr:MULTISPECIES: hypothetical protein [unclassified Myxococcus]MBZ4401168.1 hypothetical protein [Myxococcus sp. AS-1-15]MBZ4410977.1 hypothetical protein [Myxococcus sp. XM-1-1-1]